MYPFIETIRIEKGRIHNLSYHNRRLNQTRKIMYGIDEELDLAAFIHPETYDVRTKCRVEYAREINKVEYASYPVRPIHSLRSIACDEASYDYKSTDREQLNNLFAGRDGCDDILVVRNGLITDTSICNVAFGDGICWVTPRLPLLCGTKRASLLDAGQLIVGDITWDSLVHYSSVRLFNAMIDFGEVELPVDSIRR